jgi:hypothetical protein
LLAAAKNQRLCRYTITSQKNRPKTGMTVAFAGGAAKRGR